MSESYRQILRSSSIMGSAQALAYLIGLIRIKAVAVLLGPAGVGLLSLYTSALALIGTVSALGLSHSSVREVAQAHGQDDAQQVTRTVYTLRRACWVTGLLGWGLAWALAQPISQWLMGAPERAGAIAVLGFTLLLGAINAGQVALLQGLRRIGSLARVSVGSVLVSSAVAVAVYSWLGERGIVPVIIATSAITLAFSYAHSSRIVLVPVNVTWGETVHGTRRLVKLGAAFMWSGLLGTGMDMLTRSLITRQIGLEAAGIYQAAWALSGLFAAFILDAMGADFYPRLAAVIDDHDQANRSVNEQTEIGILLALPGLVAMTVFASELLRLFYSDKFVAGTSVLSWLVASVFARVISWPMGFILYAKGASSLYFAAETMFFVVQGSLLYMLLGRFGIEGAAYASVVTQVVVMTTMLVLGRRLIGFKWSRSVCRLLLLCLGLVITGVLLNQWANFWGRLLAGAALFLCSLLVSIHGLTQRLGPDHKISRIVHAVPGFRRMAVVSK